MTDKNSNDSRRKLLKSIVAGSGAVVAGKSLPESWAKPIVDTVLLPAHAETTAAETNYLKTMGFDIPAVDDDNSENNLIPDQKLVFALGGLVPNGNGTVTISNLAGDLNSGEEEQWTIKIGSTVLGNTENNDDACDTYAPDAVFSVSLAVLQAAVSGGNIVVTAVNGGDIQAFCGDEDGETTTTMDVTLAFPALA